MSEDVFSTCYNAIENCAWHYRELSDNRLSGSWLLAEQWSTPQTFSTHQTDYEPVGNGLLSIDKAFIEWNGLLMH